MFHEEITEVRELLNSPEAWTQGFNASTHDNSWTQFNSSDACKWCLNGAILRVTDDDSEDNDVECYMNDKSLEINGKTLIAFNDDDNTSHYDVLNFIDVVLND